MRGAAARGLLAWLLGLGTARLQMIKLRARLSYLQQLFGMLWLDLHAGLDYYTSLRGLDGHDISLFQIFQKPAPTAGLSLVLMPTRH